MRQTAQGAKQDDPGSGDPAAGRPSLPPGWTILAGITAICVAIEAALSLADFGAFESVRLRARAYEYGGFWPGLLKDWGPNYPLQPYAMFVTYAFLHGGLLHLAVNMATLWSLGSVILRRVGRVKFVLLYAATALGGAAGFGLLAASLRPMVGASGALFGLAGAILAWDYVDRFHLRAQLWPVARAVGLLFLLNIVLWYAMDGQLAWETHLGGFLTGWFMATLIDPRGRGGIEEPKGVGPRDRSG